MFSDSRIDLALALYDCGALKDKAHPDAMERSNGERGFKLTLHEQEPDAPLSPFYLNLRTPDNPKPGPLTPEIVAQSAAALEDCARSKQIGFKSICGLPNAGDPLALALLTACYSHGSHPTLLRLKKEDTHSGRRIVGPPKGDFKPSTSVLVVDDVITRADSKLEAKVILEDAGLDVHTVLVLVDRQQGGLEQLAERNVTLQALFTITELLTILTEHDRISSATLSEILAYIKR